MTLKLLLTGRKLMTSTQSILSGIVPINVGIMPAHQYYMIVHVYVFVIIKAHGLSGSKFKICFPLQGHPICQDVVATLKAFGKMRELNGSAILTSFYFNYFDPKMLLFHCTSILRPPAI